MNSQSPTWKIKAFAEDGTRLSALKPRRARLLLDAGLAKTASGPDGQKVLVLSPAGVQSLKQGLAAAAIERPSTNTPQPASLQVA